MQNPDGAGVARNNRNNRRNQRNAEEDKQHGAAAINNRFNMQQIAGRLRDFLETMEHQFPAANPLNQENDNDDLPELDEFD